MEVYSTISSYLALYGYRRQTSSVPLLVGSLWGAPASESRLVLRNGQMDERCTSV